jgi:hypothetical protein
MRRARWCRQYLETDMEASGGIDIPLAAGKTLQNW